METVQSRIKEEYGTTPEAIFQDKGWSCWENRWSIAAKPEERGRLTGASNSY
jgi:hypothetical protein